MDQEISFNQVTHTYQADTPFAQNALDKVSLKNCSQLVYGHHWSHREWKIYSGSTHQCFIEINIW